MWKSPIIVHYSQALPMQAGITSSPVCRGSRIRRRYYLEVEHRIHIKFELCLLYNLTDTAFEEIQRMKTVQGLPSAHRLRRPLLAFDLRAGEDRKRVNFYHGNLNNPWQPARWKLKYNDEGTHTTRNVPLYFRGVSFPNDQNQEKMKALSRARQ